MMRRLRQNRITGWRRHQSLPGTPDFFFPAKHLCLFIHGCFWHGCPRCAKSAKSNQAFWKPKIESNKRRDQKAARSLRSAGYKVMIVWECDLEAKNMDKTLKRLGRMLGA